MEGFPIPSRRSKTPCPVRETSRAVAPVKDGNAERSAPATKAFSPAPVTMTAPTAGFPLAS